MLGSSLPADSSSVLVICTQICFSLEIFESIRKKIAKVLKEKRQKRKKKGRKKKHLFSFYYLMEYFLPHRQTILSS
jgi:hypothetical protein